MLTTVALFVRGLTGIGPDKGSAQSAVFVNLNSNILLLCKNYLTLTYF